MSTNLTIGHSSEFQRSDDGTSGGTFAKIAELININGPGLSKDTVDVTDMDSPDRWRQFMAALKDGGEVTLDLGFDPDSADIADYLADINDDDLGYYKIVFPDTTEWGFAATLTGFEPSTPLDDKMVATATYKLSGKPTFVSAS